MKTLKENDLNTLLQLLRMKQATLKHTMETYLRSKYSKVEATKEYVIAHGNIPIALVAHMDTVFKPPVEIFHDQLHNILWSPTGLGADDRAGVFAISQIVKSGLRPHIILTTDEEIGAAGAIAAANRSCPFEELKYIIELDRRGSNDCVFYNCNNPEFTNYVEQFGFVEHWGTFSDISVLCPRWGVAGVNLSIGYRDEHSTSEILFIGRMLDTIEKVKQMLNQKDIPQFKYIPLYNEKYFTWDYGYGYNEVPCSKCKKVFLEEEMFPVMMPDGTTENYCPDCIVNNVNWCESCGRPFRSLNGAVDNLCEECRKNESK
jgi:hypothetical protein